MPIISLRNGITVGNFDNGRSIPFVNSDVLPLCSRERVKSLAPLKVEHETISSKGYTDIEIKYQLTDALQAELDIACPMADIVLVSARVMLAVKDARLGIGSNSVPDLWRNVRVPYVISLGNDAEASGIRFLL